MYRAVLRTEACLTQVGAQNEPFHSPKHCLDAISYVKLIKLKLFFNTKFPSKLYRFMK